MEKIIRDNVHLIPHPDYQDMKIRKVASIIEHIGFLVAKIQEENQEIQKAQGEEKANEICDLLEVYDTLIYLYGEINDIGMQGRISFYRDKLLEIIPDFNFSLEKIGKIQEDKRKKKGGFRKGIIWTYN